ncbi:MAG TPA: glutamine--tRNA ligase/YqeY domain fusion protein [Candidatus Hydrogenedentes bacterium]|nr:glutamine--tRNA ligase/YqeY domain fusion protein [Candidatus Hydrogenedentota bacterium]HPG69315.1 glutamine--tRNA ligase/YqeY domain fusion protein [Candidatus Hydrogenedentota bacterium]
MGIEDSGPGLDFIRTIVAEDCKSGKWGGRVFTRFPPEPNGYLHIGHAKSICLNFGIAQEFGGQCHFRLDDSNPLTEKQEYVDSIREDIHWLGFDWGEHEYYASDYFDQLHAWAIQLIKAGKAYVCDLDQEVFSKEYRGTITEAGKPSPYRDRSVEENLDLFERMNAGEFDEGSRVLRAKIDMASPNMLMRDPVMYRIVKVSHYRAGDKWNVYPMYDFTHGQSDSIEKITHSICTLEFEVHRPLYDWYCDALGIYHPQQIEFARLNLTHTLLSKRRLIELVEGNYVSGWDDPRMPTICGLRRRGYTPESLRDFCGRIGVAKADGTTEVELLEHCLRADLNKRAPRVMAVLDPIKVVIENYPEGQVEEMEAVNNPEDESAGTRKVPFSRELYIEREDFMEDPPRKFYRLSPGAEVRLRYAYFVKCVGVVKDPSGNVVELRCTYDPETRGGNTPPDGRKVKATLHWVSAAHACEAEVRLYDHLFKATFPGDAPEGQDWKFGLNPDSLQVLPTCYAEPSLADAKPGDRFQFERKGYFCCDPDTKPGNPVFNRTATLRDTWAKVQKAEQAGE